MPKTIKHWGLIVGNDPGYWDIDRDGNLFVATEPEDDVTSEYFYFDTDELCYVGWLDMETGEWCEQNLESIRKHGNMSIPYRKYMKEKYGDPKNYPVQFVNLDGQGNPTKLEREA